MKTAIVTGASKGIGEAIAISLAQNGYNVIINFKSDIKAAEKVLESCNMYSDKNILFQADVSKESEVVRLISEVKKNYLNIDVLINNAGIFDEEDGVISTHAFENIFYNNLLSTVNLVKYSLPLMTTAKIINISSVHAKYGGGRPGAAAYSAMKAALENYTINLAKELAPRILVNAISPGRVNTPMWNIQSTEEKNRLGEIHLINRMIEPQEIADAVLFLTKNDAVTGTIIGLDGGYGLK